jgi:hypothetical protein
MRISIIGGLAEKLRVGNLDKSVFKAPRQFTRLRELSRIHMTLVGDVVRVQARIKSLYRSRGIFVSGVNVYGVRHREEWQKRLCSSAQTRATRLFAVARQVAASRGDQEASQPELEPSREDIHRARGLRESEVEPDPARVERRSHEATRCRRRPSPDLISHLGRRG